MKQFNIDNINVVFKNFDEEDVITDVMAKAAVDYAEEHKDVKVAVIHEIIITKNSDDSTFFDVEYNDDDQPKFGRIRRITGYLTGTTARWNDSKRCELKNRVTHIG